ncbi:hypothetical protein NKH77_50045 [Streptomyces sp. M19]
MRLRVLDEHLRPVPRGVPGELFIGGRALAAGYHRRPDLTAERFPPDPYGDGPDDRLYRTGDLVVLGPADELRFLGRSDGQVKLRGFRVELGRWRRRCGGSRACGTPPSPYAASVTTTCWPGTWWPNRHGARTAA